MKTESQYETKLATLTFRHIQIKNQSGLTSCLAWLVILFSILFGVDNFARGGNSVTCSIGNNSYYTYGIGGPYIPYTVTMGGLTVQSDLYNFGCDSYGIPGKDLTMQEGVVYTCTVTTPPGQGYCFDGIRALSIQSVD